MQRGLKIDTVMIALILLAGSMAGHTLSAQSAPAQSSQPAAQPSSQAPGQSSNPFPDDTTKVPVMPSNGTPALPPGTDDGGGSASSASLPLPSDNADPVRSPDDPTGESDSVRDEPSSSSSSSAGMDRLAPIPDDDRQASKHRKLKVEEPEHQETSTEDIHVGEYYLESKNWKAALSRFESAMVLAPDEPDVYWGLAESSRHLGDLAKARGYYQKVAEYDPDSKHGKESIKLLKEPEIANAKAAAPASPAK